MKKDNSAELFVDLGTTPSRYSGDARLYGRVFHSHENYARREYGGPLAGSYMFHHITTCTASAKHSDPFSKLTQPVHAADHPTLNNRCQTRARLTVPSKCQRLASCCCSKADRKRMSNACRYRESSHVYASTELADMITVVPCLTHSSSPSPTMHLVLYHNASREKPRDQSRLVSIYPSEARALSERKS